MCIRDSLCPPLVLPHLMPQAKYWKNKIGYVPCDKDNESVAKALAVSYTHLDVYKRQVMGIEGTFLFRIGDAGVPDNQLQLATSSGNVTDAAKCTHSLVGICQAASVTLSLIHIYDIEYARRIIHRSGKQTGERQHDMMFRRITFCLLYTSRCV